ncbi:odorant receptor Or1-like [Anoplophora glabripennis]|uniref:odorant receptor Or1-like n=1 Tax=Anoplophora glabripennis TaxID=217634 RepID=UPI0008753EFE|nr:odorant receptor Or1-like [Anoplophora glabripennis]
MPSNDLVQRSFKYHLIIMKIFGLYPFDSWPQYFTPYALFLYVIFTIATPILAVIHLIVGEKPIVDVITENGFMIVELIALIAKFLPFKMYPERTKKAFSALNKEIFNNHLPEQEAVLDETVENCRFIFRIFCMSCAFAVLSWASLPLMYEDRRFPIDVWLPFEPFENTAVYLSVYLFVCLSGVHAGFDNATVDSIVALLIYNASSQVIILKDTLMYLSKRTEDEISKENRSLSTEEKENLKSNIIYKKICHCVDHYNAIYQFVEDLEDIFSMVVFSQLIASIIIICICCLQLSVAVPFTIPFFGAVSFLTAALLELFLYCYSGTLLFEESGTIVTAIYMSNWYNYDKKSKKALLTMMERAKRPMMVTAGKLMNFSLETFSTVIRRSYSLLAVLKNN